MLEEAAGSSSVSHVFDDWATQVVTLTALPPCHAALMLESQDASPLFCALLSIPYLSSYFASLSLVPKI